jgi:hypothetical protein
LPRPERSEGSIGGGAAEQQRERAGVGCEQRGDRLTCLHVEVDEQVRGRDGLPDQFAATDGAHFAYDRCTLTAFVDCADPLEPRHPSG